MVEVLLSCLAEPCVAVTDRRRTAAAGGGAGRDGGGEKRALLRAEDDAIDGVEGVLGGCTNGEKTDGEFSESKLASRAGTDFLAGGNGGGVWATNGYDGRGLCDGWS